MFENLTKYLTEFSQGEFGSWVVDNENDGTPEHPIQMPHVNYSGMVNNFTHDVYAFVDDHQEMCLSRYQGILEANGIKWGEIPIDSIEVEDLNAQCVLALILGAVRAERFCDGALLRFFENGMIERCLLRLKDLEEES